MHVDIICTNGDVRLVGGSNPFEGRIEVCFYNQWGTICDSFWGNEEARVICRQLGYSGTSKTIMPVCILCVYVLTMSLLLLYEQLLLLCMLLL